jgi:hypothetical protein
MSDVLPFFHEENAPLLTYQYLPLMEGEIRLLKLFPSLQGGKDEIRGTLIHVSIDNAPKYEALSYAWGKKPAVEHIIIDGAKLLVKPNLMAAMHMLREGLDLQSSQDNPRVLWIDAICINQNNSSERTQQVGFMCQIYSQLSRLIVWLGKSNMDSQKVISAMRSANLDLDDMYCISKQGLPEIFSEEVWRATEMFFQRSWFNRAWVVQEFVLGGENISIRVGEEEISPRELSALNCWWLMSDRPTRVFGIVHTRWVDLESGKYQYSRTPDSKYNFGSSLLYWLDIIRGTLATDPRDKVFAAFGLAERHAQDSSLSLKAIVNYETSVQDVYANLVKAMVNSTGRLDILLSCLARGPRFHRSWVPDWRTSGFGGLQPNEDGEMWLLGKRVIFKASLDKVACASFSDDMEIMHTRGFMLDVVSSCSSSLDRYRINESVIKWMIEELVGDAENIPVKDLAILERTISVRHPRVTFDLGTSKGREASASVPVEHVISSLTKKMQIYERYFFTSKYYLGKDISRTVEEGDLICILFGCPLPVTLRKHTHGDKEWYEFLRGVYVDGFMYGEAMAMEGIDIVDFELR